MVSKNPLLYSSRFRYPQTFLMHISDSVIPFSSIALQLLNQAGMKLSSGQETTLLISQGFSHSSVSQENQTLW